MVNFIMYIAFTFIIMGIGLMNFSFKEKGIWDFFQVVDTATAITLAVLAGIAYWEYMKGEKKIKIYFKIYTNDNKFYIKPVKYKNYEFSLPRKNVTRSEILGLLGMIKDNSEHRFNISTDYLEEFFENLDKVQKGDMEMFVPLSQSDYSKYFEGEK